MIDLYVISIKKYSPAGDGEPAEEWTTETIHDSSLEMMIKRYQNYIFENALKCGDIEFIGDEMFSLSSTRMIKFKVYVR